MSALLPGWEKVSLAEVAKVVTGKTPLTAKKEYYGGPVPFVAPGDLGTTKYIVSSEKSLTLEGAQYAPIVPVGSTLFTCIGSTIGKIGLARKELRTNQQINSAIPNGIDSEYLYYALAYLSRRIKKLAAIQAVPIVNKTEFENQIIVIPEDRKSQKAIADILQTWDTSIEKTEALITAKETQFDWLKYKLITCNPGAESWEIKDLNCFMNESTILHGQRTATVAAVGKRGIRDRSEVYSKELSKDYTKNKLVRNNEIAFGLASDSIVYGINLSDQSLYSVSPAYRVFSIRECDSAFLKYLLDANNRKFSLKYLITSARQGKSIDFRGLLNERIKFPPLPEQKRIAETLNTARQEIDTLKSLAYQYRTQKRGLMQKLLTGKWRLKVDE